MSSEQDLDAALAACQAHSIKDLVKATSGDGTKALYGDGSFKVPSSGGSGLTLISSGKITTPVEYFDVALPSGYDQFKLNIRGIQYSFRDSMGAAVSADGGATFINDTVHGDSYFEQGAYSATSDLINLATVNPLMGLNQGVQGVGLNPAHALILNIFPGSATETFSLLYTSLARNTSIIYAEFGAQGLNPLATVPPTPQRINLMRVLPFGYGDCDPPTSRETITSGSWTLFGIPTPS